MSNSDRRYFSIFQEVAPCIHTYLWAVSVSVVIVDLACDFLESYTDLLTTTPVLSKTPNFWVTLFETLKWFSKAFITLHSAQSHVSLLCWIIFVWATFIVHRGSCKWEIYNLNAQWLEAPREKRNFEEGKEILSEVFVCFFVFD